MDSGVNVLVVAHLGCLQVLLESCNDDLVLVPMITRQDYVTDRERVLQLYGPFIFYCHDS